MDCEESLEMMFVYFAKAQEKERKQREGWGELLSGRVVHVRNSLLCKFVPQKLQQLWTVQMLTNVEAAAPFFETESRKKNTTAAIKAQLKTKQKWHCIL